MRYDTLIDVTALHAHLSDPHWAVVDCRFNLMDAEAGRRAYRESHLPGARYAHLDEDLSSPITPTTGRHPLPDPAQLARKLGVSRKCLWERRQRLGIPRRKTGVASES